MATTRRYQSDQRAGTPQGRDPFSYGQGIRAPAAPNIPMPPRPAGAPPGPPRIYEPRITPAEAQFKGQAQIASQLSQTLDAWGDRFYKQAAAQAEKTGYETGLEYGHQTDSMELRGGTTIYDMAFNKGARETYKSRIQLDAREKIDGLEINFPADASKFDTLAKAYSESTVNAITDPETKAYAAKTINGYIVSSRSRITKKEFENNRETQRTIFNAAVKQRQADIEMAYREGDYGLGLERQAEYERWLVDQQQAHFLSDAEVFQAKQDMRDHSALIFHLAQYRDELIQNKINPETGISTAEMYLTNFYENRPEGMRPDLHETIVNKLNQEKTRNNQVRSEARARDTAVAKAFNAQLKQDVKDATDVLHEGLMPPNLETIQERAAGTEYADVLARSLQIFDAASIFRKLPHQSELGNADQPSQESVLAELESRKEMSAFDLAVAKRARAIYDNIQSELKNGNGLQLAVKDGLLPGGIAQIDLRTVETLTQSLQARAQQVDTAEAHYGANSVPHFLPSELDQLQERLIEADSDEQLQFHAALVSSLGQDALKTINQLVDNGAGVMAVAGGLVLDGEEDLARQALKGQAMLAVTPGILNTSDATFQQAVVNVIYQNYTPTMDERRLGALINTVGAVYAHRARLSGSIGEEIDDIAITGIVNEITGGFVTLKGVDRDYTVPAPVRGWDDKRFEQWIDDLTVGELAEMGGTGVADSADVLEKLQDNQYQLVWIPTQSGYALGMRNGLFVPSDIPGVPFILSPDTQAAEGLGHLDPSLQPNKFGQFSYGSHSQAIDEGAPVEDFYSQGIRAVQEIIRDD